MGSTVLSLFAFMACIWISFAVNCPPDFGGRCTCGRTNYNGRSKFIVNCTNTQFNDASMLEKLPNQTEVVIFTGYKEVAIEFLELLFK